MNALSLFNNLEREFNRPVFRRSLADDWFRELTEAERERTLPSVMNFDEKSSTWNLTIEVSGVTKENVKIDSDNGFLRIAGEKTKGLNIGKFEGLYRLPEGVDAEKIEAALEDGVLAVSMPVAAQKLTKTIQIK